MKWGKNSLALIGGRALNSQPAGPDPAGIDGPTQWISRDQLSPGPVPGAPPPMGGPWPPAGPPPVPGGPPPAPGGFGVPPRKRRGRAIASVVAVIVAVVVGIAVGLGFLPNRTFHSVPRPSVPDPAAEGFVYRFLPMAIMPDLDALENARIWRVTSVEPPLGPLPSSVLTTPPICSLEYWPYSAELWGKAMTTGLQAYTNLPEGHSNDEQWHFKLFVGVAVFRTSADALATVAKLTDSVNGCTMTYTDGNRSNSNQAVPAQYTVNHRESSGANGLTWEHESNNTTVAGDSEFPMSTGYAYRVVANLAVLAQYIAIVPKDEPTKAVDLLIANANARNHK
ncbi:hypothetical protein B5P44_01380 [Mycobacterium sp. CBMA 213]|uniref:sensor domain-containing protein n=1 Tax=unclassified Mycolicibacterium TaxID=2636767 RepID=UPI0012DE7E43|nr:MULTISPECIES: sensor domain-containing protein [unclassified Mycolicibacterium]MUL61234.1 sensor domain-containing protein [Mycolicibacterium sp. CBMA 335]MUM03470.1 hypothetical protein [Mycolicibacterium sp. CBMA 213]